MLMPKGRIIEQGDLQLCVMNVGMNEWRENKASILRVVSSILTMPARIQT
jgi:hypothetical protein